MKKLIILFFSIMFCANIFAQNESLSVWSFTDEILTMIENYYKPSHPNVRIDYSLTPTDKFPDKLDDALLFSPNDPEIFALENAFVTKYVEHGEDFLLDLTDIYNENKDKIVPYIAEIGSHNGKVYALSWQTTPGAMFYRRSLAKKFLGTDDPVEVQKYFNNWESFLKTAREIKNKSFGRCKIVSSGVDLYNPLLCSRTQPWIVNGKITIDPAMEKYMDLCKILNDEDLDAKYTQWTEGWFAGMKDELKNEDGKSIRVFCYFMPTWGLYYTIKPNAGDTDGDWAMIQGPAQYYWSGTWIAANKNARNPALAKDFIKYVCINADFQKKWAKDTRDMVSNLDAINKIKDTYSDSFLGGQNYYAEFAKSLRNIHDKNRQSTDQMIEGDFGEAVWSYVNGRLTKGQALMEFKKFVAKKLNVSY